MERPIIKPLGTPVEELDSPSLIIDVDILDHNINTVHSFFKKQKATLRPNVEAHRTPAIALKQIKAGGTSEGIAVSTIGQAEVFFSSGFKNILILQPIIGQNKIKRLCSISKVADITVLVDNLSNVQEISKIANDNNSTINLSVGIDCGKGVFGITNSKEAVNIIEKIQQSPSVTFQGIIGLQPDSIKSNNDESLKTVTKQLKPLLDTLQILDSKNIEIQSVAAGNTSSYDIVSQIEEITEVIAGKYAIMDLKLTNDHNELNSAAQVLTTITGIPEQGVIITDGGQKAIGADLGEPTITKPLNLSMGGLSAEHGNVQDNDLKNQNLKIGDKIWVSPWDSGECCNLHDYIHAIKDEKLIAIWEVSARGVYR